MSSEELHNRALFTDTLTKYRCNVEVHKVFIWYAESNVSHLDIAIFTHANYNYTKYYLYSCQLQMQLSGFF